MMVLAFWWTATGILFALQRNVWTRSLALAGAAGALVASARLLSRSRDDLSAMGAIRAFFAGALAWSAIITLFFEGWVVGPAPESLGSATRGWAGALTAIAATWHWEALALLTIALVAYALRGAANRLALWTLLLFWVAHQSAKLNLFFGVVNSGSEIFPPYLTHLVRYFGPEKNSPLLPLTIVAYAAMAVWVLTPWNRCDDGGRMRRLVIAALAGLAAVEHGFLATRLPIMLWELFLRVGRA
jgi:putative photosynthetic complex assembly protein 2